MNEDRVALPRGRLFARRAGVKRLSRNLDFSGLDQNFDGCC